MDKVFFERVESDICNLLIAFTHKGLVKASFDVSNAELDFMSFLNKNFCNIKEVNTKSEYCKSFENYYNRKVNNFDIPLQLIGTEFNKKVWTELMKVPYGDIKTYKQIAEAVDCPVGYRAVGNANNKNPIVLVIPCHRIVGSNASLTGFAPGIKYKARLLEFEGHTIYEKSNKMYVNIK